MSAVRPARATLDDLSRTPGKAELIGGRIVRFMATGRKPSRVAGRIYRSLDDHATQSGRGEAHPDNLGYAVPQLPSGRESFSPDASYYEGPLPANPMRFIEGPPTFAAEVLGENDYGPAAEAEMADKRADYFAAGTRVVWDVDPLAECVHVYNASDPSQPITYQRGQTAEAEPAVPVGASPWIGFSVKRGRTAGRLTDQRTSRPVSVLPGGGGARAGEQPARKVTPARSGPRSGSPARRSWWRGCNGSARR